MSPIDNSKDLYIGLQQDRRRSPMRNSECQRHGVQPIAHIVSNCLALDLDTSSTIQAIVHIDGTETIDPILGVPCVKSAAQHEMSVISGLGQSISIGPLAARQPTPPEGGFSIGLELVNSRPMPGEVTHMYYYGAISPEDGVSWTLERIAWGGKLHTAQPLYGSPKPSATVKNNDGDECVICLSNPKEVVILHCRHVCLCQQCATITSSTWSYQCPVCRGRVSAMCALTDT